MIEQIFHLKQNSLKKAMKKFLSSKYKKIIETKEYLIAIGDIPVALTSHLDTVFKTPPKNIFYDRVKNVMWSPEGLGADDRAGVFSIIQILNSGFRPTIIFTTDEEIGGVGAEALVKDYPDCITSLKYIIELDRRGSNDCVFYDCDNTLFNNYIEKFGFVTNFGTFSDISEFCPSWGIAGVNLSVGYYNEHSVSEVLFVGQMFDTIEKVKKMLSDIDNADFFDFIPLSNMYSPYCFLNEDSEYWDHFFNDRIRCANCGKMDFPHNMTPVKIGYSSELFCPDCIGMKDVKVCKKCGECFISFNEDDNSNLCSDCKGSLNV